MPNPKTNIVLIPELTGFISTDQISPDVIINARQMRTEGHLRYIDSLFDYLLEYDDNLAGNCDVRVESIRAREYTITNITNQKQLDFLLDILKHHYDELVQVAVEGKLYGHLFRQIVWENIAGYYTPAELIDYKEIDLRILKRKIELFVEDERIDTDDHRFLKKLFKKSILNSLCKYYAFSSFALNNWASFTETFGKPLRLGKYEAGASANDVSLLKEAVESLGDDQAAVIPKTVAIEFIDHAQKTASKDLYESLASFARNAVTKRILGQILTTEAVSTGSYAQSKTHDRVRHDILRADLRDCENLISHFLTVANNLNFPDQKIEIDIDDSQPVELSERIAIDRDLVLSIGLEIDEDYFYKTYKVPKPDSKKKL